jgi:hypothetical protein
MKKLAIVCLAFIGCASPGFGPGPTDKVVIHQATVYTYVIDGCEYLGDLEGDRRTYYLAHKGNCKNKIHDISNN